MPLMVTLKAAQPVCYMPLVMGRTMRKTAALQLTMLLPLAPPLELQLGQTSFQYQTQAAALVLMLIFYNPAATFVHGCSMVQNHRVDMMLWLP